MKLKTEINSFLTFRKTINEIYQPKNNAFDIIRFILASLVLVFHSYIFVGSEKVDFLAFLTKGQSNFGEFSVGGFFAISGFLVAQSLINSKNVIHYFWKRSLRLFPALFVSLFFSSILLGPFITNQHLHEYFFVGGQGTNPFKFIFLNFTLNIFGFSDSVRDLFMDNPYPSAVNGSLWTLKHEFASYTILSLLAYIGFIKRPKLLVFFTAGIGSAFLLYRLLGFNFVSKITTTWWIFNTVEYPYFLQYLWLFLMGAILYIYREALFISTKLFILFLSIMIGSIWTGCYHYAWFFFSPYLIIAIAILLPLSFFSKYGDFSYGIYVYAFPVQQTIVFLLYPDINVEQLMLYAFVATLIISMLSWKFIEKPALSLKNILK